MPVVCDTRSRYARAMFAPSPRLRSCVILAIVLAGTFGGRDANGAPKPPRLSRARRSVAIDHCFSLAFSMNSRGTNELFRRRNLQAGGPTWAPLLLAFVRGYTTFIRQ